MRDHALPCPWRLWMYRLALCLESSKPHRSQVAAVLRILGAAAIGNSGISRDQGEAALREIEVSCGLLSPSVTME